MTFFNFIHVPPYDSYSKLYIITLTLYEKKFRNARYVRNLLKVSFSWKIISLLLSILYLLMTSITEVIKDDFPLPAKCILLLASFFSCFLLLIRAGFSEIQSFPYSFRKIGPTPVYTVMIPITI